MAAIGRTTEWHESKQKYQVAQSNANNEKTMQVELKHANKELKVLRSERMKELYIGEAQT